MAECVLLQAGGGGLDPDELTATAGDVLKGMLAGVKGYDDPVYGTLELTGSAADSQVLAGQTYYNTDAKTKRTGGMPNKGAWTGRIGVNGKVTVPAGYHNGAGYVDQAITNRGGWTSRIGVNGKVTIPEGYHNGGGYVDQAITNRGGWTGSVAMNGRVTIPEGYHNGGGYVDGPSITNRGGYRGFGNSRGNDAGNKRIWVRVPGGYYNENAEVYLSWADIRNLVGLTPDKLKKNVSIMDITGSWEGYANSPLFLYNNGVWSNLQTPGVTEVCKSNNVSKILSNKICWGRNGYGSGSSYEWQIFRLNQSVNLTDYKYIKVTEIGADFKDVYGQEINSTPITKSGSIIIGISPSPLTTITPPNSLDAIPPGLSAFTKGSDTIVADISSYNGNYWIFVGGCWRQGLSFCANAFNQIFLTES